MERSKVILSPFAIDVKTLLLFSAMEKEVREEALKVQTALYLSGEFEFDECISKSMKKLKKRLPKKKKNVTNLLDTSVLVFKIWFFVDDVFFAVLISTKAQKKHELIFYSERKLQIPIKDVRVISFVIFERISFFPKLKHFFTLRGLCRNVFHFETESTDEEKSKYQNALNKRLVGVLSLIALCGVGNDFSHMYANFGERSSCLDPYTVPDWMPKIVAYLTKFASNPSPIDTHVKAFIQSFKKTHEVTF